MFIINPYIYSQAVDTSLKMEFRTTTASTTVHLPINTSDSSGRLVFDDGTSDIIGSANYASHTFATAGDYVIKYYGTASSLKFSSSTTATNSKLIRILDWGITGATSAKFQYCASLLSVAGNLESTTTSLYQCFANQSGNVDVSLLDTSNVTDFSRMFFGCSNATPDTSGWDTSSAVYMDNMFYNANAANPDTSGWDTSNVTRMHWMFTYAFVANPDVSGWDTSNVTNMSYMFYTNSTSRTAANPDTSGWDTSNVTNFQQMFYRASLADPDMSSWNFSSASNYNNMLYQSGLSTANYNGFLNKLNSDRATYSLTGRAIGDIPSTYTTATSGAARTALLANSWTFTDDGGV
jgi:surface protein